MQRQLSNVSFHSYQEYQPARKYGPQYEPGGYAAAVQQRTNMTQREDALKFEQGRIKALQEERLHIQKKTFTKWVNSFLQKARMEVEDLFQDLSDGRRLLKLLEIISGERLPRPHSGRMRVHKIENVNKSLSFLHTKVRLESIGAEDIVDGNPRLILGLIWTIILRFQIQEIEIDVDEENVSSEKKSAKDALLLWCQRKTSGYHGVHIHNFTDSWRSGLGFNALIHAHRPDLFRWAELPPEPVATLNHAFDVAHNHLGIPKLLDAEDVDTSRPDEKSVMTYVASYYHTFARMKNEQKSGRRIANIIGQMMECDARKGEYSRLVSALLEWIRRTIAQLDGRELPNALDGIQRLLLAFKQYRTVEKPPKYKERSEIEALYFDINTMQKSLVGEAWSPLEGQLPQDLERAWQKLEQAEHAREIALRTELLRQQRLEQLNYKFNTKSVLRKGYLKEMIQVLSDPRYGSNLAQVDATLKKHEAISADILARTERFEDLSAMAAELVREGYHGAEGVARVEGAVLARWRELLALLERHRASLAQLAQLMALLREADAVGHSLGEMKAQFSSSETGRQLADVERLLQAHALQELTLGAARDSLRRLQRAAGAEPDQRLTDQLQGLGAQYEQLVEAAKDRKARLEDARNLYQFLEDHDEEEGWVTDKQRICRADVAAKDLRGVTALRQKHTALMSEMRARDLVAQRHRAKGQSLIDAKHSKSSEISRRLASLGQQWDTLRELAAAREKQLADAAEAHQFYGDANEAESWMKEKRPLVSAGDVGADAPAAAALLRRLRHTHAQLTAHRAELDALQAHAARLADAGIHALQLPTEVESVPAGEEDEFVNESRLVPTEVWEEEPVERLEHRTVTEERSVPQVKALYAFSGQGISMSKGEVMFLINKTNPDWWSVRKADRTDGFVPANYVREVEPRVVPVQVRRPEKVRSVQRVKKTVLVKQVVPVRRAAPRRARAPPATRAPPMQERVQGIFKDYEELLALSEQRRQQLEDAIKLYSYFTECDDFDKWMREKEKMLRSEDGEESVDTAKRKYEKFVTDLSAASKRLEHIVEACAALGPPSQAAKAHARAQQLQAAWDRLQRLRQQKEKSLEGASSVELFSRTCDEALEWMISKEQQLSSSSAPHADLSLTSVRALQRRHAQLERELEPVKEKVNTISLLADSVKSQYPSESENISSRQREIHAQWRRCEAQARERRGRLESAVGHQIFSSSAQDTHHWIQKVRSQLAQTSQAKDVATADALHKQHQELLDDIKAHDDDVKEVISLGKQLLSTNPALTDVAEKIQTLETEQAAMKKEWQEKEASLKELAQLQAFNREADRVDAATRAHEACLEYAPHGSSVDEAEALVKRHEELEARLSAQDERVTAFTQRATALLQDKHRQSEHIAARLAAVVKRREGVKQAAAERRRALHTGLAHQQFVASAEELQAWIEDKTRTAKDQSYRDLANLERKLQKHEAFERELQANEKQLRNVESIGSHLSSAEPARADEIQGMAAGLRAGWAALGAAARAKGARLRQAALQRNYKRSVDDAKARLQELERALKNEELGADLRSCKKLLTQHQALELELSQCAQKAASLAALGEDLVSEGHFDSDSIRKEGQRLLEAVEELKEPAAKRRKDLETSLQIHKFSVEVSNELDWLSSRRPAAEAAPADLHAAQHALKNHHKLRAELHARGAARTRLLQRGAELRPGDRQKGKIAALCQELESSYASVVAAVEARGAALEAAVKEQQFQHDAAELDAWLADKGNELAAAHLGDDRHRATQLLTRHKAVELELDTYAAIISEMGHAAAALDGGSGALSQRHAGLQDGLQRLQRAAGNRQAALVESVCRHEYMAESAELESWIQEQYAAASSEDYGQDYEHLLILRSKFEELRLRVECGAERFTQCEELAHKLAAGGSPHLADIERRQQALGESWQRLVDQIASRGSRLHAAGDIHRFHRDVCELLARAGARRSALAAPPPPRDLRAADKLLRNHQAAHNELVAIDAQAQVLQEEGTRLISLYPGDNVQQIKQQQQAIRDAWEMLQQQDAETRRVLEQYQELHQFLAEVRDLLSYLSGVRAQVAGGAGGSAGAAAAARARHDALRAELDATDAPLQRVLRHGQALLDKGHPNAQEISEKCAALVSERAAAGGAWAARQVALDQLLDLHCFRRDLAQLADLCAAHEAVLQSDIPPNSSVEEVDNYIKKHEAFEKLLATQDEKLSTLNSHGEKLLQQNHVESQLIAEELDKINARRKKVYALSAARRARLSSLRSRAQFARDAADARGWVLHKLGQLDADHTGEVTSLEEKIKKLQKHQAFSAELVANRARLKEVQELAARLEGEGGGGDEGVRDELRALEADWERLEDATEKRGRGLEEAQDILEFNQHLDKIEAWIRDKEMMVLSGELGRDFEHCSALVRKLDDVDSDMQVDDKRVKSICALADKLLQQGPSAQSVSVSSRRDAVLLKWRALSGALQAYRDRLAAALEIHRFNRDVEDTAERLSSKASLFKSMSVGRELSAAHELVKRHHARVAEAGAVRDKIDALKAEGEKLQQRFPERAAELQSSVQALEEGWGTLERLARQRTEALDAAVQRHKFDDTLKDMELWVSETVKRMDDAAEPESVADAEALLELHKERKAEIDGRQKAIASLQKEAEGQEPEARRRVAALAATLDTAWAHRKQYLTQAHQLQLLKEQARQTEDWLASKEAFLNNDDLGENLAAVEALIRKHAEFSKLLDSQLGRVEELQAFAREIQDDHYSKDYIEMRMKSITARRDQLKESCATRGSRLQQSRQLQQFLRDLQSEREYIALKMQLANDDNYRDLSNLQSKIQKHAAFESELAANKGRIDDIANTGEGLIEAKHYASQEIAVHVEELENDWRELQAAAKLRRERLDEAYQARVFLRGLDEFTAWLDDVEAQLLSEDHGVDLSSVTALLKRHARLEQTVSSKAERCAALADTARQLPPQHFMRQDILARCDLQTNRYRQLQEPMQIRRDNLEDAALLHRWERDADDEFNWLKERDAALNQEDLGSSLQDAQALLKKHLALEAEIIAREPSLKAVVSRGSALVRRSHFASPTLEPRARALAAAWDSARAAAARRTMALKTACDLMQLLSDIAEAEAFLSERRPLLVSADVGRDEESALALEKRLDGLQRDLNAQDARIAKLQERATMDDEQLKRRLEELKTLYEEMKLLSAKRQQRLQQSLKYFKFAQECEEVQEWVGEQMAVAASEEYGLDVEHVETLQQSFDNFLTQLHANEGRIEAVCESGLALLDENTPESERVKQRIDDIRGLWDDLKELALARQEALAGARQVHEFDRLAAETVVWVQERLAALHTTSDRRAGHALDQQYRTLTHDAERLGAAFPDAREHVTCKLHEVRDALEALAAAEERTAAQRALHDQLEDYFDRHQELLAWSNEMLARVTAPDLAPDVPAAERLVARHHDLKVEIDAKEDDFNQLYAHGEKLVTEGHLMSAEITSRMATLRSRRVAVEAAWDKRASLYEQHLDALVFKRDADALDAWITNRVPLVRDGKFGESLVQVERLLNKHRDLEETIDAQRGNFDALKRITLVEQAFQRQKNEEEQERRLSAERQEQERLQQYRRREMERIAEERRKEGGEGQRETAHAPSMPATPEETTAPPQFDKLPKNENNVKRAESMSFVKSPRRTPSFTTRRRTQSFRRHRHGDIAELPPVEIEGFLERKQETGVGGKRATVRSWRNYYSVLCGQLLCFFKDEQDFANAKAAAPPVAIMQARCAPAADYSKRSHVFRLSCADGAEFLFAAASRALAADWTNKVSFHAALPPELQLTPYSDVAGVAARESPSSSSSASPSQSPAPRRQADILRERDENRNIESSVLPSPPPRLPTPQQEEADVQLRGEAGGWGRSRFSNGRVINAEFIRSQQTADTTDKPPPVPARPSPRPSPRDSPGHSPRPAAPRMPPIPDNSVSSLVNSYQQRTNRTASWSERQNNNWQSESHFYTNDVAYGASGPRPASVATSGGSPALDQRPASRSSGESELSVSGVSKEKKDKKGVFGGLFRKKRPQSHNN